MCTTLGDPWIEDIPENQHTVKKDRNSHVPWDKAALVQERPSGFDVPVCRAERASWAKDTNKQHRQDQIM